MPNALRPAKSTRLDALLIALVAGDCGLTRRGLEALYRIRSRQREVARGARGAFVKIDPQPAPPLLDLAQVGRDSPLVADFHALIVLDLVREFPRHAPRLKPLLDARRNGLELPALVADLWADGGEESFRQLGARHGFEPQLMSATLWAALNPLYTSVSEAFVRHFDLPGGDENCPVCGGSPWARCGDRLRCTICESVWTGGTSSTWRAIPGPQPRGARRVVNPNTGHRVIELEDALFAHAYDLGPLIELMSSLNS